MVLRKSALVLIFAPPMCTSSPPASGMPSITPIAPSTSPPVERSDLPRLSRGIGTSVDTAARTEVHMCHNSVIALKTSDHAITSHRMGALVPVNINYAH